MPGAIAAFLLPVAEWVAMASLKATLVIALVLLSRKLLARHLSAGARHCLWLIVLVALLLPVGWSLPLTVLHDDPLAGMPLVESAVSATPEAADMSAGNSSAARAAQIPSAIGEPRLRSLTVQEWLVLLWATTSLALATITAINVLRYRRIARRATTVAGPASELLLECAAGIGLHRPVRLLQSARIRMPVLLGWRSPILLVPPGFTTDLDVVQLRHVLLHELAHVQRHDILTNWFATGAQIVHWFNPLVWYGVRTMRADMEQACDARVLALLAPHERRHYGLTLLAVLDTYGGPVAAPGMGVVGSHAQLKERVAAIAAFGLRQRLWPAIGIAAAAGLVSLAAIEFHPREQDAVTPVVPVVEVSRLAIPAPDSPAPLDPPPTAQTFDSIEGETQMNRAPVIAAALLATSAVAADVELQSPPDAPPPSVLRLNALQSDALPPLAPLPQGWGMMANGGPHRLPGRCDAGVDTAASDDGPRQFSIRCTNDIIPSFGGAQLSFDPEDYLGKRVRVSGWLKVRDVQAVANPGFPAATGSASLWLGVGSQADGLRMDRMQRGSLTGSSGWEYREFVVEVPKDSRRMLVGFWMEGKGQVWVRDLQVEVVSKKVPIDFHQDNAPGNGLTLK